jgi:hypothetical protein
MLTLITKVDDAIEMKYFRPISLLNRNFKIFSKSLTIRLEKVCQRLIAKEQNAFIRGRYILESVAGWRGKLLAYNSRLVLIKSCLANISIYLMFFIKFPKWAIRLIDS